MTLIPVESLWAFLWTPGPMEMMALGVIAVLLFGGKVPEVARSIGKGLNELKKGMRGVEDEFRGAMRDEPTRPSSRKPPRFSDIDDRDEATGPKFEPPPAS